MTAGGAALAEIERAALAAALAEMAPPGVISGVRRIDAADEAHLHPEEVAAIGDARAKRRMEFASGRMLLRELLGRNVPMPIAPSRRPVLPAGIVATLAHDDRFVVAAVTTANNARALGVDVEPIAASDAELDAIVLRPDEAGLDSAMAFVSKEAAYKAFSALGGPVVEHRQIRIAVADTAFTAEFDAGTTLSGRFSSACDRWVAFVVA